MWVIDKKSSKEYVCYKLSIKAWVKLQNEIKGYVQAKECLWAREKKDLHVWVALQAWEKKCAFFGCERESLMSMLKNLERLEELLQD